MELTRNHHSPGILPWKPRSIVQYPKPLLTLLGERDGYIRFTGGALEYAEIDALKAKKGFEVINGKQMLSVDFGRTPSYP